MRDAGEARGIDLFQLRVESVRHGAVRRLQFGDVRGRTPHLRTWDESTLGQGDHQTHRQGFRNISCASWREWFGLCAMGV